jgi:hypothetical protein
MLMELTRNASTQVRMGSKEDTEKYKCRVFHDFDIHSHHNVNIALVLEQHDRGGLVYYGLSSRYLLSVRYANYVV